MRYALFILALSACLSGSGSSAEAESPDSLRQLEAAIEHAPKDGDLWVKLGYAHFAVGDMKRAERAFRKGIQYAKSAAAYTGMGLIFMTSKTHHAYNAPTYFRRALRADPTYIDAQIHLARFYVEQKNGLAERALRRVIAMDSTYTPAYLHLAEWYAKVGLDVAKAAAYYDRYLALVSDDGEGYKLAAAFYFALGDYEKITETLAGFITRHPTATAVLPVLAYSYLKLGNASLAERYFDRYLTALDSVEKALYDDIRFVASGAERAAFDETPIDRRPGFLHRFWNLRDPDITTPENERRIEHCWRVWYARHYFSAGREPWDRRGEVYIRFGEADYRSRSDELNFDQSLAVQKIKERLALSIYGAKVHPKEFSKSGRSDPFDTSQAAISPLGATYIGPVYPVRSLRGKLSEFQGFSSELFRTSTGSASESRTAIFRPVTASENAATVAWENWVYVDIGDGLDITFTDERGTGTYEYAPAPPGDMIPLRQAAALNRYNPRTVTERAAASVPDYYRPAKNKAPAKFYYAAADFRGANEKTACEIYLGVPYGLGYYFAQVDETRLAVERTIALINTQTGWIYRHRAPLHFKTTGDVTAVKGAFVPDVFRLDIPPGSYRLETAIRDLLSTGRGRYRQAMEIEPYSQTRLQLSDLELAWEISESDAPSKFRKGPLAVIPMPTRTYPKDRPIVVYYEIYNLKRNAFGQTQYRVEYSIRSQEKGVLGTLISHLVKTVTRDKDEEIAIDFEQSGLRSSESTYVALDLTACGLGRHLVRVAITDLISGETTQKEAAFVVAD